MISKKGKKIFRQKFFMNDFLEIGEKVMIDGWQKTVTYYHSGNKEEIDES